MGVVSLAVGYTQTNVALMADPPRRAEPMTTGQEDDGLGDPTRCRIYTIDQAAELWGTSKEAVRDIAKRRPASAPIAWPKAVTPFKDWVFDADRLDALVIAKYLERGELAPTPPPIDAVAEVLLPALPGASTFPSQSRFAATPSPSIPMPSPLDDPELRKDMALAEARESGRAEGSDERRRLEQLISLKDRENEKLSDETERLREALSALVKPAKR